MADDAYDPIMHWTAGELRERGVPVGDDIPDCAYIPRERVQVLPREATLLDDGTVTMSIRVRFSAPFRWLSITVSIPEESGGE